MTDEARYYLSHYRNSVAYVESMIKRGLVGTPKYKREVIKLMEWVKLYTSCVPDFYLYGV